MIEALITPKRVRARPWDMLIVSFLFVSFAVLVHILLPSVEGGAVIFAMIPAIPLIWNLIMGEEKREEEDFKAYETYYKIFPEKHHARERLAFFTYHRNLVTVFAFFFLGAFIAYLFWSAVLPQELNAQVFKAQLSEVEKIQSIYSASALKQEVFTGLLYNNLGVLVLMFIFSLLYGIGSIYLLLWNASIIGVFIGSEAKHGLLNVLIRFLGILPHGILEIGAYFVASIAGGILSVAIMRSAYRRPGFKRVMLDVLWLSIISFIILAVGALVESAY